jgi:hypothetical protein
VTAKSRRDGAVIEDPYVGHVDTDNKGLNVFRQALDEMSEDDD